MTDVELTPEQVVELARRIEKTLNNFDRQCRKQGLSFSVSTWTRYEDEENQDRFTVKVLRETEPEILYGEKV